MTDKNSSLLSDKKIPPRERLICALDVPTIKEAEAIIDKLGDSCVFYKMGLQLLMSGDYFPLIEKIQRSGKKVFADIKFFDVPQTVKSAVKQLVGRGIQFVTVHGNDAILRAAVEVKGDLKILAVTALTSLDQKDMEDLGFSCKVEELVLSRARRALEMGCDGIISSGWEVSRIRHELGPKLVVVTPGIRPGTNTDDQKRTVSARDAFLNGADYIVVGRPIIADPNPRAVAESIQQTISELFGK